MMQAFEKHRVALRVSVTQQFNTATSMGRLILNVLLSFAQFEREIIAERTRDKIAATRRKGKWSGGQPLLGYDVDKERTKLVVNEEEAAAGAGHLRPLPRTPGSPARGPRTGRARVDDQALDNPTGRRARAAILSPRPACIAS